LELETQVPDPEQRPFRIGMALLAVLIIAVVAAQLWGSRVRGRGLADTGDQAQALKGGDFSAKMELAWPSLDMGQRALDSYEQARPWPAAFRCMGVLKQALLKQPGLPDLEKIDSPAAIRDLDKKTIRKLHREKQMWLHIYGPAKLSPDEARRYARQVRDLNLGPLTDVAEAEVYRRAGMKREADRLFAEARDSARVTVVAAGILIGMLLLGGLGGTAIAVVFLVTGVPRLVLGPRFELSPTAALSAFIVYLASYFGLSAGVEIVGDAAGYALGDTWAGAAYMALVIVAALTAFALGLSSLRNRTREYGQDWRRIGYYTWSAGADVLRGLAGFAASLPFVTTAAFISLLLSKTLFRHFPTPEQPFGGIISEGGVVEIVLVFLAASVVAPIVEETFFRGALYTAFRGRMGMWPAVFLSSAIFAVIHPLPGGFLPIFSLACVLALLRERSGSLLPCMVCHVVYNTVGLLLVTLVF
jgi:membrane protease YdiL (CAAX protease family)